MPYFKRKIDSALLEWSRKKTRKPLLLRGARQVGKTSAIRNLGKSFQYYVEINFDDVSDEIKKLFQSGVSPQEICSKLSVLKQIPIVAGKTLVFFDEIQSHLPALSRLRYFYEQYPELHVVAAGSLLEFALEEIPTFGVGRIDSMFMYPFSFQEFLRANGNETWANEIAHSKPEKPVFDALHRQLNEQLKIFIFIGGMPEVVAEYVKNKDLLSCQQTINNLLVALKTDFAKYKKRIPAMRINEVFTSVARQVEGKFVYEHVSADLKNEQVKIALELLIMAGLVYPVVHTSADGIPLGSGVNPKYRRIIPFDTGLYQRITNLDLSEMLLSDDFDVINKGALAEIYVGCELKKAVDCSSENELYCWVREKKNASAQIDFIIQKNNEIVPVEVKSGETGKMQSMWIFLSEKKLNYGIRTSLENYGKMPNLDIFPLYAVSNLLTSNF
jgi:predicted AAA+ superfamily ATPase